MSEKIEDGGPAFPTTLWEERNGVQRGSPHSGMSLHAYAAVAAMQGMLASNATYNGKTSDRAALARDAVGFADSLLVALTRRGEREE